jgi:hypothetical protein
MPSRKALARRVGALYLLNSLASTVNIHGQGILLVGFFWGLV